MSFDWKKMKLDEIVEHQKGFAFKSKDYIETGTPIIRVSNFTMDSIDCSNLKYVSDAIAKRNMSVKLDENDVVIATVGSWPTNPTSVVGKTISIPKNVDGSLLNQNAVRLRVKNKEADDQKFLYYLLKNKDFSDYIVSTAQGSANQASITLKDIYGYEFLYPEPELRKTIASYLSAIDKKIHINTQTNQTLEEMAQAIFKSWFVDFDPVKAKMNGQQPMGMDEATATLFPDKLVESELGLIPEGWKTTQIGDIVERLKPKKRYTKKQVEPYGKTPVYEQGASILLGFHNDNAGFNASPEEPIFIFGDHTCITHLSCSKFDISSNVIPLKGSIRPTSWTYYAIQGKQKFQEYRRHWSEFIIKGVVLPPIELTEKYAELVTTSYLMMESLKRQSKELEQLRETLLPKLLSGEIELGTPKK